MAEGKLIVVSNRLPLSVRRGPEGWVAEPSSGGLASAVNPILKQRGGLWIGWPGHAPREADADRRDPARRGARSEHGFVTVDLPADLARRFYEGYANQTLWPLFHNFATNFEADPEGWTAYVTANRRFRDAVLEHLEPGDTVWIHDYHLMLLPRLIRDVAPEARVGFFLHIPFPASETFRILPHRDEVLRGLLGRRPRRLPDPSRPPAFPFLAAARPGRAQRPGPGHRAGQLDAAGGAAHRHRPRGVRGVHRERSQDPARLRGAAQEVPQPPHPPRRRSPRLHEGDPGAPARLPQAAPARARTCAARSCSSRWRCPRASASRNTTACATPSTAWWARSTASSARRNGRPSSTSGAPSRARSWWPCTPRRRSAGSRPCATG